MMIDLTKLDLKKIFGISRGTEGMKRNQTKFVRAEIFEEGMEEYSDGQLHYVGDTKNGADFIDNDGVFYESKGMDGMFSKRKHNNTQTKSIVLKNFRKQVTKIDQTFSYMLLWDTKSYSFGWCTWDACIKNLVINGATATTCVDLSDVTMIAENVEPENMGDFDAEFQKLKERFIKGELSKKSEIQE